MEQDTIILSLLLFNIFFIAFTVGIVIFIRQYDKKKRLHTEELEKINLLHKKELLKTQMEIQSQTMKYIGREIHDNVGQKLTLSSMYLQQLVFENKTQEITKNINNVNDIINESLKELRHLSKSLTDDTVQNSTISELLASECKKFNALKTHKITFNNDLDITLSAYQIKSILLRITQEFLHNSIKHADCDDILISISNTQSTLTLLLKDNGCGFDINDKKANGIGLKNTKKRVNMIGGKFEIESNTNGTKFHIKIPITS